MQVSEKTTPLGNPVNRGSGAVPYLHSVNAKALGKRRDPVGAIIHLSRGPVGIGRENKCHLRTSSGWGGLAALVGGVLFAVADLLILAEDPDDPIGSITSASYALSVGLGLLSAVLLTGGLVGIYAARSEATGVGITTVLSSVYVFMCGS